MIFCLKLFSSSKWNFSVYVFWRTYVVLSTDANLNKLHFPIYLSISFFFTEPFVILINLHVFLYCSLRWRPFVWSIQSTSIALRLRENFLHTASWHSKFVSDCLFSWEMFALISGKERMLKFDVTIYLTCRKISVLFQKKIFTFYRWKWVRLPKNSSRPFGSAV